jgi:cobalt-zinc-cadmium efflux system membrane fusion protein
MVLRNSTGTLPGLAPAAPAPPPAETPAARAPAAEVEIVLSPEAVARAGIKTAKAEAVESNASIRVPGSVVTNAYREVKVTPLVGGIVTKVHAELGTAVKRGAPLATLFSAELADAQTKYLSMTAMVEADYKKLQRTQRLAEIGAASRQELEDVTAVHASRATELEAARQRLLLLGLSREQIEAIRSPSQVYADVIVPVPIDGVITGRSANLGQVVGMGQELFVVTDLSEVWVIGDLYEQDFQTVRVGSEASITTPAYPALTLRGRVSYIDPRVDPQTRTAKVRVEIPNTDGRLKLGMYVTISFTTRGSERVMVVPRTAVHTIGERQVVFVPVKGEEGKFLQRVVRVGRLVGEFYTILSGLKPGEVVVTEGSFFLRAESIRTSPSG